MSTTCLGRSTRSSAFVRDAPSQGGLGLGTVAGQKPIELILARNLLSSLSTPAFLVDNAGELTRVARYFAERFPVAKVAELRVTIDRDPVALL